MVPNKAERKKQLQNICNLRNYINDYVESVKENYNDYLDDIDMIIEEYDSLINPEDNHHANSRYAIYDAILENLNNIKDTIEQIKTIEESFDNLEECIVSCEY